jgi:hypothetical protein
MPIGANDRVAGEPIQHQLDVLAEQGTQHRSELADHFAEIERLLRDDLAPAECEKLARQARRPFGGGRDLGNLDLERVIGSEVAGEEVAQPGDRREHIVEIVRDGAGKASERLHLLRLAQLLLELVALTHVLHQRDGVHRRAIGVSHQRGIDARVNDRPVRTQVVVLMLQPISIATKHDSEPLLRDIDVTGRHKLFDRGANHLGGVLVPDHLRVGVVGLHQTTGALPRGEPDVARVDKRPKSLLAFVRAAVEPRVVDRNRHAGGQIVDELAVGIRV